MSAPPSVLITGGASGIGWATAHEFLSAGWRVAIGDVSAAALEAPAAAADRWVFLELDVTRQESVEHVVDEVVRRFGGLDALVNNAGVQRWTSLEMLDWDTWSSVLEVNLNGVLRCLSTVGRHMLERGRGSIVNITSVNSERGLAMRAPYSASKAAVNALTRTAAVEWASRGVRVNAVGPGYVATALMHDYIQSGRIDEQPLLERIPLGRMAEPTEIARAVRFLSSDEASYITGQVLYVDGGFLASSPLPGTPAHSNQQQEKRASDE